MCNFKSLGSVDIVCIWYYTTQKMLSLKLLFFIEKLDTVPVIPIVINALLMSYVKGTVFQFIF